VTPAQSASLETTPSCERRNWTEAAIWFMIGLWVMLGFYLVAMWIV